MLSLGDSLTVKLYGFDIVLDSGGTLNLIMNFIGGLIPYLSQNGWHGWNKDAVVPV